MLDYNMVVHAVRKIPKANWINDRDQFKQPTKDLPDEFITNCTIWNLFATSNQTTALKNVQYEGSTYQIINNFFPFNINEVRKLKIRDEDIQYSLQKDSNRFVAEWLSFRYIPEKSSELLALAVRIYEYYYLHLHELRTSKYKIQTWDAGWYQIRMALNDRKMGEDSLKQLKRTHNELAAIILPVIYEYGFL